MTAKVKHANWGSGGNGIQAKLYIKTGAGYTLRLTPPMLQH
ncbi:hypothetical protein AB4124_18550 [Paenibacillus sp. 2KB_20]